VPWEALESLGVSRSRTKLLPDPVNWIDLDLEGILERAPDELVLPGPVLVEHLVAIDWIRGDCGCRGNLWLAAELPPEDIRLRCEKCFISEEPART